MISLIGFMSTSVSGPFVVSTNVFLGTVVFHVQNSGTQIMQTGFFDPNFVIAEDASLAVFTPDFSIFVTNPVPEPGVATLMAVGLLGLVLAGRK
jgi:hypothetical protein